MKNFRVYSHTKNFLSKWTWKQEQDQEEQESQQFPLMIVWFFRIQKVFNQREKKKYKTLRINLCLFFKKTFFAIFSDKICWCLYYGVSRWFWGNDQDSKLIHHSFEWGKDFYYSKIVLRVQFSHSNNFHKSSRTSKLPLLKKCTKLFEFASLLLNFLHNKSWQEFKKERQ